MAINPTQLVLDQLSPVLPLDAAIEPAIPRQVEAQIALQGWTTAALTDQQAVYISVLATQALIPRLLLTFAQEIKRAKGGPAETEFQDAVEFLKALREALKQQVNQAAREIEGEDVLEERMPPYPKPEIMGFE